MVKKTKEGSDRSRIETLNVIKKEISENINNSEDYMKSIKKLSVPPVCSKQNEFSVHHRMLK